MPELRADLAASIGWVRSASAVLGLGMLTLLAPAVVHAQPAATSDSSPFRAGQYGVEFGLGGFASLGVLRFSTPKRALLFDVQGRFDRGTREQPGFDQGGSDVVENSETNYALNVRAGSRKYRPVTATVQRFTTFGAFARVSETETSLPATVIRPTDPPVSSSMFASTERAGGLFAELGATWMVTSNLSLGAAWSAQAFYSRSETTRPLSVANSGETRSTWGLSVGNISVRGNLYF